MVLKLTLGIYVDQFEKSVAEVRDFADVRSCFAVSAVFGDVVRTFPLF